MKLKLPILSLFLSVPIHAHAAANVALGKPVIAGTSGADFYNVAPDAGYNPAAAATVTDGIYRPTGVDWKDGTVFWADSYAGEHWVEIELGGLHEISGFKAQLNENDYYVLHYLDSGGQWQPAWTIGQILSCCMQVREVSLLNSIVASALKLEGFFEDGQNAFQSPIGYSSDNLFSVSEIEAYGAPYQDGAVPEPASLALLGLGLAGLPFGRRRVTPE